jgi:hypothetical protein
MLADLGVADLVHIRRDTLETAHDVCRKIVEDSLAHVHRPGMTAQERYKAYGNFGDDPFGLKSCAEGQLM